MHLLCPALVLALAAGPIAAAPAGNPVPDTSTTERSRLPEATKARLEDLFASPGAWRAERAAVAATLPDLDRLSRGWAGSAQALAGLLEWRDAVQLRLDRLYTYASFQSDMDQADSAFQAMKGQAQDLTTDLQARLAFLEPGVLALGRDQVERWLAAEPRLAPYRSGLRRILRRACHVAPAGEERVAAMTTAFTDAPAKASSLLNDVDIPRPRVVLADGSEVTVTTAAFARLRGSRDTGERRRVVEAYWTSQLPFVDTQAALLDAEVKTHLFDARVHGYPTCLESALHPNAIDPAVYRGLVATLRANLAPLHRLLRLRRRMLGLDRLRYADLYATGAAAAERWFTYDQAKDLVRRATVPLGPEYARILAHALDDRWVDVYPNRGKQSGAYCTGGGWGRHPFVKLNYDGTYGAVSTLAHELGHALHSALADAAQPYATSAYPTFLAEVASTFNENLLMRHLLGSDAPDAFKLFVLDNYLEELRGTLYRQGLFAEFELAMHGQAEQGLTLTPEWLNRTYLELTRQYYGHDQGVVQVDDWIQAEWSAIPHFYMNFYVFQYATSMSASMALARALQTGGDPARDRYLRLLRSGGSRFPVAALREAGVDFATPRPVEEALRVFDDLVGELEALWERTRTGN